MPRASGSDAGFADAGTDAAAAADAGPEPTGSQCFKDEPTGVVLCSELSTCPSIIVDETAFPSCGFRVQGAAIDLECVCGDELCAMGAASTCAQAAALLALQTEGAICAQVSGGTCVLVGSQGSASSSGSGSTCDPSCQTDCNGDPDCLTLCGC